MKELEKRTCKKCGEIFLENKINKYVNCSDCRSIATEKNKLYLTPEKKAKQKQYFKKYYKENKEELTIKKNEYIENIKEYVIYMFLDEEDNVLYVGSTNYINNRIGGHFYHKLELFRTKLKRAILICFDNLVSNRNELYFIENLFIKKYNPSLNKHKTRKVSYISIEKMEKLIKFSEQDNFDYEEINITKYIDKAIFKALEGNTYITQPEEMEMVVMANE